ncbi:MAG: hypothetical protein M4579_001865 [Chaenotheca gracillima]|nr:MAG: hypothetical protein M4579_001865 [Chaenotheca gracillima]
MSLADYLAKNYLTADPAPEKKSKKRKRKGTKDTASAGLVIADDDDLSLSNIHADGDEDDGPLTGNLSLYTSPSTKKASTDQLLSPVSANSAEFRKAKKSTWQTVGVPARSSSDQAAADAIIASAAAEQSARADADTDAPDPDDDPSTSTPQMESGAHAGLQSASQVTAAMARRRAEERARFESQDASASGRGQETIYRDASGRIINVAMKRAEARKKAEEASAAAAAAEEAQKGAVQQAARASRQSDLREAKYMPVARFADDTALNEELKEKDRWNDPAAAFLTSRKAGKSITGKPLYKGGFAPNRYGIRPGYRWDGVDRGNGFEKTYFQAMNRRKNIGELEYAWQMDE